LKLKLIKRICCTCNKPFYCDGRCNSKDYLEKKGYCICRKCGQKDNYQGHNYETFNCQRETLPEKVQFT